MKRHTLVFGPAYLDRVLRVDRPLLSPESGGPIDGSYRGRARGGDVGPRLVDPLGNRIVIDPPDAWPGPWGEIGLERPLVERATPWRREVRGLAWGDDLGGMGAGFAAALDGTLVSALGPINDPASRAIGGRLAGANVVHRPIRVSDQPADWTLLVTSGPFGDKLAVGFRGCHDAIESLGPIVAQPCDLRVVAGLPNRLSAEALRAPGAEVRCFAPAMRNALDRARPVVAFAEAIDVLSLNRREWDALEDREAVGQTVSLLAITDGPRGSLIRYREGARAWGEVQTPAFPRVRLPRDTNRAGEAFAATLVTTLLDDGWRPGPVSRPTIAHAARRASAAAALVLDHLEFGFPAAGAIDAALRAGRVEPAD